MLPSPSSSPRQVLAPLTNTIDVVNKSVTTKYLPTPPAEKTTKRRRTSEDKKPIKRLKLEPDDSSTSDDSDLESDEEDVPMEDPRVALCRQRQRIALQFQTRALMNPVTFTRPNRALVMSVNF